MRADDAALVRIWQMAPHVQAWRDDEAIAPADGEPALDATSSRSTGSRSPTCDAICRTHIPKNGLGAHLAGTRGIDQFIGAPDMLGRGRGSGFVRAFADALLTAGVPRVINDPALANARAMAAYAKAGFRRARVASTPAGGALLMLRGGPRDGRPRRVRCEC